MDTHTHTQRWEGARETPRKGCSSGEVIDITLSKTRSQHVVPLYILTLLNSILAPHHLLKTAFTEFTNSAYHQLMYVSLTLRVEKHTGSNVYWSEGDVHFLECFVDVLLHSLSPLSTGYTRSTIASTALSQHFKVVEERIWQVEGHMTVAM